MGKAGKKRSAAPGARHRGRPNDAQTPAANPFELLHARKKFNILGKRQKGGPKSKLQARSQANQRRKDSLLVEYQQQRKANSFVDRRFGEDDDTLTAEEKAVMRFQKQRIKDAASSRFQLPDEDGDEAAGEGLTHMGRSLSDFDTFPGAGSGSDSDADAALDAEATATLNFGGGFVRKAPGSASAEAERPKTKKEVMEELIAKSKAGKAERQQQREEDLTATEQLDATFRELLDGAALQGILRPKGEKIDPGAVQQGAEEARFDRMRRELTWAARGAPGERTRTSEELAELERLRLEALERQRLKRMRGAGGDDSGSDLDDAAAPLGGYALRRHKAARTEKLETHAAGGEAGGDDLDDDFAAGSSEDGDSGDDAGSGSADESDEEGTGPLQRRQRERAAGDHELQARLRQVSAALLQKHGVQPSRQSAAELAAAEDSGDEQEGSSAEEAESGSEATAGSCEDEESDSDADPAAAAADDSAAAAAAPAAAAATGRRAAGPGADAATDSRLPAAEQSAPGQANQAQDGAEGAAAQEARDRSAADASTAAEQPPARRQGRAPQLTGPLDVSFVPDAPKTYAEFSALVSGRPAGDLPLIVARIRGANAAALAADNRRGLQLLYGNLVQHFVGLAGGRPPALAHLDALTPALVAAAAEVPFYAATLARARLGRAQQRLAAALKDPGESNDYGWPGGATVLSLRLWGATFPVSDRRHPVATPVALLLGKRAYLAACPVVKPRHAAVGLLLAGLAHACATAGGRLTPEALNFVTDLLADAAQGTADSVLQLHTLKAAGNRTGGADRSEPQPLRLSAVLGPSQDDAQFSSPEFAVSVLAAAAQLLGRMAQDLQQSPAFPELFRPAAAALDNLAAVTASHAGLDQLRASTLADVQTKSAAAAAARRPLARKPDKAAAVKLYNPRFEDDYVAGKDFDPDRERAATKRLKRQVQKERRGAMRELRKDATFLDAERERERGAGKTERRTQRRAGFAMLEQLEADMKSGGQGGLWKKKHKKS